MRGSAVAVNRRAAAALAGAAGPLLLEGLLARARNLGTHLRLVRAGAKPGEIGLHDLPDEMLAVGIVENAGRQVDLAHLLLLPVPNGNLGHAAPSLRLLLREARAHDHHDRVPGARNRAADVEQVLLGIDPHDDEVLGRRLASAQPARRPRAREDARRERRRSDRARRAVEHRAVGRRAAAEIRAGATTPMKPLPLRRADDVDVVLLGEDVAEDLVAGLELVALVRRGLP